MKTKLLTLGLALSLGLSQNLAAMKNTSPTIKRSEAKSAKVENKSIFTKQLALNAAIAFGLFSVGGWFFGKAIGQGARMQAYLFPSTAGHEEDTKEIWKDVRKYAFIGMVGPALTLLFAAKNAHAAGKRDVCCDESDE